MILVKPIATMKPETHAFVERVTTEMDRADFAANDDAHAWIAIAKEAIERAAHATVDETALAHAIGACAAVLLAADYIERGPVT